MEQPGASTKTTYSIDNNNTPIVTTTSTIIQQSDNASSSNNLIALNNNNSNSLQDDQSSSATKTALSASGAGPQSTIQVEPNQADKTIDNCSIVVAGTSEQVLIENNSPHSFHSNENNNNNITVNGQNLQVYQPTSDNQALTAEQQQALAIQQHNHALQQQAQQQAPRHLLYS